MEDSEVSEKKSQPSSPSQGDKRKRKSRTFSFSDDENKPPSPKVTHTGACFRTYCVFNLEMRTPPDVWLFLQN